MIKKALNLNEVVNENMRGGDGQIIIRHLADKTELYDKSRLYANIIIKPGCSIGYHVHENEMEVFYIISGKAIYDDNGVLVELSSGDVTFTYDGEGHSIANKSDEDLELIALIVLK